MPETARDYGDPTDWDEIPPELSAAIEGELEKLGWSVLDAHQDAITVDAPGLDDGEEWCIGRPNFHGWWAYGVYTKGYCANPEWLYVDPVDPQQIAAGVDEILRARRTV